MADLESKIDRVLSAGSGINIRRWKETNYPVGIWKELVAELRQRFVGKPVKLDLTFKNQVKDPAYGGSLTGRVSKYRVGGRPYFIEIQNLHSALEIMAEAIAHEMQHVAQWESGDQRPERDLDKEQDAVNHEHVGREVWTLLLKSYKPLRVFPKHSEIFKKPEGLSDADWALVDRPLASLTPEEFARFLELREKKLL